MEDGWDNFCNPEGRLPAVEAHTEEGSDCRREGCGRVAIRLETSQPPSFIPAFCKLRHSLFLMYSPDLFHFTLCVVLPASVIVFSLNKIRAGALPLPLQALGSVLPGAELPCEMSHGHRSWKAPRMFRVLQK